jgi:hypothetical protein
MGLAQNDEVSGAGEFHPHALPEPYVSLSAHDSSHAIANFAWDRAVPYQRLVYQKP